MKTAKEVEAAGFLMFVSSVEGHLVTRYGSRDPIGAKHTSAGPVWNTAEVVAFTQAELDAYGNEYRRALKDEALRVRTVEEFLAWYNAPPPMPATPPLETRPVMVDDMKRALGPKAKE